MTPTFKYKVGEQVIHNGATRKVIKRYASHYADENYYMFSNTPINGVYWHREATIAKVGKPVTPLYKYEIGQELRTYDGKVGTVKERWNKPGTDDNHYFISAGPRQHGWYIEARVAPEGRTVNPVYKFPIGQEVKHEGKLTTITNRELGAISLAPYYKVAGSNHWIVEEDIEYHEPLADWEKALLAPWFAIGDRVKTRFGDRQGTIVDFDYEPDRSHPGVKWDGRPVEKSLHYSPEDLIKVEQDKNMLIPIGTKVKHGNRNTDYGEGEVIEHVSAANKVQWADGVKRNHDSSFLTIIEVEQIKGDDPRLKEFWEEARKEADRLGFCGEYEKLATKLQTPKPTTEIRKVDVTIPVRVTVEVEVKVGEEPADVLALNVLNNLTSAKVTNMLDSAVAAGQWTRGTAKVVS